MSAAPSSPTAAPPLDEDGLDAVGRAHREKFARARTAAAERNRDAGHSPADLEALSRLDAARESELLEVWAQESQERVIAAQNREMEQLRQRRTLLRVKYGTPRRRATTAVAVRHRRASAPAPVRSRGSRRGTAATRAGPSADDDGESEPPGLILWRHPKWGATSPNLLRLLLRKAPWL